MIGHAASILASAFLGAASLTGTWRMEGEGDHVFRLFHDQARGEVTLVTLLPSVPTYRASAVLGAIDGGKFSGPAKQRYAADKCEERYVTTITPVESDRLHVLVKAPASPLCGTPPDFTLEYHVRRVGP